MATLARTAIWIFSSTWLQGAGNELRRVAGLTEELSGLLGVRVDVVAATLLRDDVAATALNDAVAV